MMTAASVRSTSLRWGILAALAIAGGAALGVRSPVAGAWLITVLVVLALAVVAPLWLLALLPFAVAFGSLLSISVAGANVGPTDLIVGALVLSWLVRLPRSEVFAGEGDVIETLGRMWRAERARMLVFAALLAYLAVICLSLVIATSRTSALKEVLKWSEVTAVVALTIWLVRSTREARLLAWALIGAGVAETVLGYVQWVLASGDLGPGGASVRVFGTFAQPNPYGGFLNFSLPLALALVFFGRDARERWVAGAASVLLLVAQGFADSRGALLGLGAAVVVLLVLGVQRARIVGLVGAGVVVVGIVVTVLGLLPGSVQRRVASQVTLDPQVLCGQVNNANFSTMERLAHWVAGLRMFAAHPLLGVGAGNYNAAYYHYNVACWQEPLGHAHNYYINVGAETGVPGVLAFLALCVAALYAGWVAIRRSEVPRSGNVEARALALGFTAVVAALLVHNLTDDLFVHAMELQFALCLGCLVRLGAPGSSTA